MQTILVGYDDSEQAQRALDRAIELGKALGAEIVVASVAPVAISSGRSAGRLTPRTLRSSTATSCRRRP